MTSLFLWVENSAFSVWLRETPSLFGFSGVLVLHTWGLAFMVGTCIAIDLRVLGVGKGFTLPPMASFFPVVWYGFWVNAISGLMLLYAYPAKSLTNPIFGLKLALIAAGLVMFRQIKRTVFPDPDFERNNPVRAKALAWISLACWLAAITAGRLLAYTYSHELMMFEVE